MESFLYLTAKDLYETYGDQLADVAVIFPNNRARHFFSEQLYQLAGKPVWTPSFLTIQDLFRSQTTLQVADTLTLVAHLHRVYMNVSGRDESFDEFYLWGELLLSDFDDVDKNLADATQLFRNIKEQAAFTDNLEHLSEDQEATIRRFFGHFNPERKTELKQRFIENWNHLMQVYTQFGTVLEAKGLAYEGRLHRHVLEALQAGQAPGFDKKTYAFVGFNVLNQCEKNLFKHLMQAGKALFYWDYDHSYLSLAQHEAARFMRQNLLDFPNRLDNHLFNSFTERPKRIRLVASASENAQARYIPTWLESLEQPWQPRDAAVVLGNEHLLLPVLHSIPDSVSELNVTMGFPLNLAPVSNLVIRICQLHATGRTVTRQGQTYFHHRYVQPILQHPLIRRASPATTVLERELLERNLFRVSADRLNRDELLRQVFSPVDGSLGLATKLVGILTTLAQKGDPVRHQTEESHPMKDVNPDLGGIPEEIPEDPLTQESVFQMYLVVSHLKDAMETGLVQLGIPMFQSLLQRVLSVSSIPFSGEPVRGMQIMGLLETRNLDFEHVLILSVNEGMLPKKGGELSFIPYNLRIGFGLTTADHKDSIFAYYFFRLLQRAGTVTLVYNTTSDGMNRGEMSRFVLQLLIESPHPIDVAQLHTRLDLKPPRHIQVDKSQALLDQLKARFQPSDSRTRPMKLSPSALNTFIDCSLRFYFRYVAGLKEPDSVRDEIDGAMLGTFFHHAAEYLYTDLLLRKQGLTPDAAMVEEARKTKGLTGLITPADLQPWLKGERSIDQLADHVIRTDFLQLAPGDATPLEYNGEQLIRLRILTHFLHTLLRLDAEAAPFTLKGMEQEVDYTLTIDTATGPVTLTLGGYIDRLHEQGGRLHVMDYKTGGNPKTIKSIDALFEPTADRPAHAFQLLFYCALLQENQADLSLKPDLLYLNKAGGEGYSPDVSIDNQPIDHFAPWHDPFMAQLKALLQGLFNPAIPFKQTEHLKTCEFCPYKGLCHR